MANTGDKKLVKSKSGYKFASLSEECRSPLTIPEPPWVPDNQCPECMKCKIKFDFFHRRHHCRRCGMCYCGLCCNSLLLLPRMCFIDPVRHCNNCATITQAEQPFFDKHLKILKTGGKFVINISSEQNSSGSTKTPDLDQENSNVYLCKLSNDHRQLQFTSSSSSSNSCATNVEPLNLTEIQSLLPTHTISDRLGNAVPVGLKVNYLDQCGEVQQMNLKATENSTLKTSAVWVSAMQKAMNYVFEAKGSKQLSCTIDNDSMTSG